MYMQTKNHTCTLFKLYVSYTEYPSYCLEYSVVFGLHRLYIACNHHFSKGPFQLWSSTSTHYAKGMAFHAIFKLGRLKEESVLFNLKGKVLFFKYQC